MLKESRTDQKSNLVTARLLLFYANKYLFIQKNEKIVTAIFSDSLDRISSTHVVFIL